MINWIHPLIEEQTFLTVFDQGFLLSQFQSPEQKDSKVGEVISITILY